jgi:hypothetical protein
MDMMREAIEKRASETLATEDGGPFLKGRFWRNAVCPSKRSFKTLGVSSGKGMVDKTIVSEMNSVRKLLRPPALAARAHISAAPWCGWCGLLRQ